MGDIITAKVPFTKNLVEWERENDALIVSRTYSPSLYVYVAAVPNDLDDKEATVMEIRQAIEEGHEKYFVSGD